jgi:hypothetical protein
MLARCTVVSLLALAACSSFDAASSVTPADAAADATADAGDGADSFEATLGGCGPWNGSSSNTTLVTGPGVAHTGNSACRVCTTAGPDAYFHLRAGQPATSSAPAGAQFYLEAWVNIDTSTDPGLTVSAAFDVTPGGFHSLGGVTQGGWQKVSYSYVAKAGDVVYPEISGRSSAGATTAGCFAVDDVVVRARP